MKNSKPFIQILRDEQPELYQAFVVADDNIRELLARITKLEERNLRYFCRAKHSTTQVIPNNATTTVNLNTTDYPQFGNMHDNTANNDKIYIRRDGVYYITANVVFDVNATGIRQANIALTRNGATTAIAVDRDAAFATLGGILNPATMYYCREGDYIQLQVFQNSGGNLDLLQVSDYSPTLLVSERREDLYPFQYGLLNPELNTR